MSRPIPPIPGRRRIHRGVGLVEMLIALAISAALLASVGVAIDASFDAYAINQSQAQLDQRARLTMHRVTSTFRTAAHHEPDDASARAEYEAGLVTETDAVRVYDDEFSGTIFRVSNGALVMVPFVASGGSVSEGTPRTLLSGVSTGDFRVTLEPQRSAQSVKVGGTHDQLKRASVTITARPGDATTLEGERRTGQPVTLSTSIMPRRNLW
jgi:prepilin-type N-terminal cleavage/methylation domain-containing protein